MNSLFINTTSLPISTRTTVEDLINHSKSEIQTFLRQNNLKVSGFKVTLAQRVVDTIQTRTVSNTSLNDTTDSKCQINTDEVPAISDLCSGWTEQSSCYPNVSIKDIENYLIHSSHRTCDTEKMQCYRQYIRGLNFYKEGYIHKIMLNEINDDSKLCYIRSKCHPSMQKGVYEQWLLTTKEVPFQVLRAYCTCPAG